MRPVMRLLLAPTPFAIWKAFRNSEPGLHLEAVTPADNAINPTMFQDSAGTTPVTAVEQPLGLWLDTKNGNPRATPDLRTSGAIGLLGSATAATFNTGTGVGTVTRVDASNQSYVQISGLTASRFYELQCSAVSGGTLQVRNGSETGTVVASLTTTGQCVVFTSGTTITLTASAAATVSFTCSAVQSLSGNHAVQSSAGARPTFTQRVNLLTYSEQFDNAAWVKTNILSTTANADGIGDLAIPDSTNASHILAQGSVVTVAAPTKLSVRAKAGGYNHIAILLGSTNAVYFNLSTGVIGVNPGGLVASIEASGDAPGYYDCAIINPNPNTTSASVFVCQTNGASSFIGNGTSGVYFARADLRTADNAAKAIPAYQRVTTASDYDTAGFPPRVVGNGTSHFMTASLDMSSTDKVCVVASVTKNSDAATGLVCELTNAAAQSFYLGAPTGSGSAKFSFKSQGSSPALAEDTASTYSAPVTCVATGIGDISSDVSQIRVNGSLRDAELADQGTGNYANSTLSLFSRGGSSLWLNGGISALTIRGTSIADSMRNAIERYHKALAKLIY